MDGVASAWLSGHIEKGSWLIDPFGASPRLAVEAAQAGYRVLVAVNNPVARFLLEIAANRPTHTELRGALSELASSHRGEERIEPHIRSLYQTFCAACGQPVMAQSFLWERGAAAPYARQYHCLHCGDEGEHPALESDAKLAAQFASSGLPKARALERVAPPNDPDRAHVEEAISHYLPRAVYVLFTLINRLDGLAVSPARKRQLQALLLYALDMGTTLWSTPTPRPRPRALVTPTHFREHNLWLALENAIEIFGEASAPVSVPLVNWPDQPPIDGGICLFEGRMKELTRAIQTSPAAVLAAIPRHNQAFWTLSALWAGWLWGREAVGPFKVVLRRRWYDWGWHTTALYMALQHLTAILDEGTPFFGLLSEAEPGFLIAALVAADTAGFALEGLALSEDEMQAQIVWKRTTQVSQNIADQAPEFTAYQAIQSYLTDRGEPASYFLCTAAGVQGLAAQQLYWRAANPTLQSAAMQSDTAEEPGDDTGIQPVSIQPYRLFSQTNAALRKVLVDRGKFINFNLPAKPGSDESEKAHPGEPESGLYWLYTSGFTSYPLADRLEIELVRYLTKNTGCPMLSLQQFLNNTFPGLFTPESELLQIILDSYAEQIPDEGLWRLRTQDQSAQRRNDLNEVRGMLVKLGKQLHFRVKESQSGTMQGRTVINWYETSDQPLYQFFPIASAVIGDILLHDPKAIEKSLIVIPGSRANLVIYKLNRDPRLLEPTQKPGGWQFIKFRHLRWLLENPLLSRESLAESLALDPLTYTTPQLRLL